MRKKSQYKKIIQCDRCSKTFYKLDNLRRHFYNKKYVNQF